MAAVTAGRVPGKAPGQGIMRGSVAPGPVLRGLNAFRTELSSGGKAVLSTFSVVGGKLVGPAAFCLAELATAAAKGSAADRPAAQGKEQRAAPRAVDWAEAVTNSGSPPATAVRAQAPAGRPPHRRAARHEPAVAA
eukprot:CAMPEP_0175614902 /NCGR_PEP_ID=MMETSP0096-20121207/65093_1 /TAXON_ID=311494 /ORGANISM="Alexandrium monilatum, Strain CCMP3105" /LENGTH=135 /DNA_ID=CAMNT_0016920023 /DNA_START=262 /DNA_END=666 /DNA_ORIENTATION=-